MIRKPLRPLARILRARAEGENPDAIERENLRLRHEEMRDRARASAEGRLLVLGLAFLVLFATVGTRMAVLASTEPQEPRAETTGNPIIGQRADITRLHVGPEIPLDPAPDQPGTDAGRA
jgi:cell division protein FtsI (penicillin-binding protein 3)